MIRPLWFFFFAAPAAKLVNATVAASTRARACDLLEDVMAEIDPAQSVKLRPHPLLGHPWTGEEIAVACGGQLESDERVLEVTLREGESRMLCLGQHAGAYQWRRARAEAR